MSIYYSITERGKAFIKHIPKPFDEVLDTEFKEIIDNTIKKVLSKEKVKESMLNKEK